MNSPFGKTSESLFRVMIQAIPLFFVLVTNVLVLVMASQQ
jgi:hypothetical protein